MQLLVETTSKLIDEDYPQSFNIEEFKLLTSFNARVKYCEQHLTRISSGSSRIVYIIDDTKVLKLAKNVKGLAQNEVEINNGNDYLLDGLVPNVYEYDENYKWFETQLAEKISKSKFEQIVGISWDIYTKLLYNHAITASIIRHDSKYDIPQEILDESWENEFIVSMYDYIGSYGIFNGDLQVLSSYGIINGNVVLIDSGATDEVLKKHYGKK